MKWGKLIPFSWGAKGGHRIERKPLQRVGIIKKTYSF